MENINTFDCKDWVLEMVSDIHLELSRILDDVVYMEFDDGHFILQSNCKLTQLIFRIDETCIYIHSIDINEEYRNMKYGSRIIECLYDHAAEHNMEIVAVKVVPESISFWEEQGFQEYEQESTFVRN